MIEKLPLELELKPPHVLHICGGEGGWGEGRKGRGGGGTKCAGRGGRFAHTQPVGRRGRQDHLGGLDNLIAQSRHLPTHILRSHPTRSFPLPTPGSPSPPHSSTELHQVGLRLPFDCEEGGENGVGGPIGTGGRQLDHVRKLRRRCELVYEGEGGEEGGDAGWSGGDFEKRGGAQLLREEGTKAGQGESEGREQPERRGG